MRRPDLYFSFAYLWIVCENESGGVDFSGESVGKDMVVEVGWAHVI